MSLLKNHMTQIAEIISSCKTRTCLIYIFNIMGADVLVIQGARASTTMIFIVWNWFKSVPACWGSIYSRFISLALKQSYVGLSVIKATINNIQANLKLSIKNWRNHAQIFYADFKAAWLVDSHGIFVLSFKWLKLENQKTCLSWYLVAAPSTFAASLKILSALLVIVFCLEPGNKLWWNNSDKGWLNPILYSMKFDSDSFTYSNSRVSR